MPPRRISPAQFKSKMRRIERENKKQVDSYNRNVRQYNANIRANRRRLENEIGRLNRLSTSQRSSARFTTYSSSVQRLRGSFSRVEHYADQGEWTASAELFDLVENETANSVAVLNALREEDPESPSDASSLQATSITSELTEISPDLGKRWNGALYALSPRNPDAARHFCTSAREVLTKYLETVAPDSEVIAADPDCPRTEKGSVSRRARIHYRLSLIGQKSDELEDFVVNDVQNVINLFDDFNSATHGEAGVFGIGELAAIKARVEGAIQFLYSIVVHPPTGS